MNDNIVKSIRWHKEQLSKLLSDDEFSKLECELNYILTKAKKQVWDKPTPTRKGHYRNVKSKDVDKKAKEPWQVPVEKFVDDYIKSKKLNYKTSKESDMEYNIKLMNAQNDAVGIHAKAIKEAVASGKNVPKQVLKDYPNA